MGDGPLQKGNMRYELHVAIELPFWLRLPEAKYEVVLASTPHRVIINHSWNRLDVGDPFLDSPEKWLHVWCASEMAEAVREQLRKAHLGRAITRWPMRTVADHVRCEESVDLSALRSLAEEKANSFEEDAIAVTNRLIQAYQLCAPDDVRSEVGLVNQRDIGDTMISAWDDGKSVWAFLLADRPRDRPSERPPPILPESCIDALDELLGRESEYPLPPLLHVNAYWQIVRGNYRVAVIDDITALEISVENAFEELARAKGVPIVMISDLLRSRFADVCERWIPALDGPKLNWGEIKKARRIRHGLVHQGLSASEKEARLVHDVCDETLRRLQREPTNHTVPPGLS